MQIKIVFKHFLKNARKQTMKDFEAEYTKLVVKIKATKAKVIYQPKANETVQTEPKVQISETIMENVDHFPCLVAISLLTLIFKLQYTRVSNM